MTCCLNCLLYLEYNCCVTWVRLLKLEIWTPNQNELHLYSETQAKDISDVFYLFTNSTRIFLSNLESIQ